MLAIGVLALGGCRGVQTSGEKQARHDFGTIAGNYRPDNQRPALPELTPESSLSNYLAYALLNSPVVEASFYDWSASVESITVTRSLPDPQLTFQAYIQGVITSLMPGFAWSFPGPGKLKARAGVAAAQSQGKYFTFEIAVLQTAFNLKRTYYQLGLLEEQLRLKHESLLLFGEQERTAHAQNTAGSASLADLLRVLSFCDQARTDLGNLEDSRRSLMENFKAALGLAPDQADPPVPAHFEVSRDNPDADELLRVAFTHNPQLKAMEADVRVAEAGIKVAYKDRVPDFSAALMADVKASPWLYWPQLSMSLPIWRDKLAAEAAGAEAEKLAAQSRLKAAQIDLAVNFAEKSFAYRQTGRNLTLIEDELIPRTRQSLQTIRAGYRTGTMSFSALTDAERILLDLQLEAAQTRTDREIALADLSIMVVGLAPANAPLLSKAAQP